MGTRLLGTGTTATLVRLAAVAGLLVLGGCGGDDSTAAPAEPTSTTTPTSPSPTPDEEGTEPAVAPATGPRLDGGDFSVNAPKGWVRGDSVMSWILVAESGDGGSTLQLAETPGGSSEATSDQLARISLDTTMPDNARRFPDVTLDGVEFYHVAGSAPAGLFVTEYGAEKLGRLVTVKFNLYDMGSSERREVVESVMASLRWS